MDKYRLFILKFIIRFLNTFNKNIAMKKFNILIGIFLIQVAVLGKQK